MSSPTINLDFIATLNSARSGKSYPVLEYHHDNQSVELRGEFDSVFSSSIKQAIRSGYDLIHCADDRLYADWNSALEGFGVHPSLGHRAAAADQPDQSVNLQTPQTHSPERQVPGQPTVGVNPTSTETVDHFPDVSDF